MHICVSEIKELLKIAGHFSKPDRNEPMKCDYHKTFYGVRCPVGEDITSNKFPVTVQYYTHLLLYKRKNNKIIFSDLALHC